jgi:hypothetical protein
VRKGVVTADNRRQNGEEVNNWDECVRIGNLLADEALRIIKPAPVQENPDIWPLLLSICILNCLVAFCCIFLCRCDGAG